MFDDKVRVLLILPQDVLDRARVLAGALTTRFKLPVSLQIVLRALIEEGLGRADGRRLLANVESQAQAVRRARSSARKGDRATPLPADGRPGRARAARVRKRGRRGE
jgi:hypothetical protein